MPKVAGELVWYQQL